MLKISRLADYSVVLTGVMANALRMGKVSQSARDLALCSGLPMPTVSKILKIMTKNQLILARRGSMGGYRLKDNWERLSLLDIIEAFEGLPALTTCLESHGEPCQISTRCTQKKAFHDANMKIRDVLKSITLGQMLGNVEKTHGII